MTASVAALTLALIALAVSLAAAWPYISFDIWRARHKGGSLSVDHIAHALASHPFSVSDPQAETLDKPPG